MRAYSTKDGSILWTFDTNRDFQTVNGFRKRRFDPRPDRWWWDAFFNSGYGQNRGSLEMFFAFGTE